MWFLRYAAPMNFENLLITSCWTCELLMSHSYSCLRRELMLDWCSETRLTFHPEVTKKSAPFMCFGFRATLPLQLIQYLWLIYSEQFKKCLNVLREFLSPLIEKQEFLQKKTSTSTIRREFETIIGLEILLNKIETRICVFCCCWYRYSSSCSMYLLAQTTTSASQPNNNPWPQFPLL